MNRVKLTVLNVKATGIVTGFRAFIRQIIQFFGSMWIIMVFFASNFEGYEILGVISWLIWMLLFSNVVLYKLREIGKPRLIYNRRKKKFYFKYNFFEFKTISRKNGTLYRDFGENGKLVYVLGSGTVINTHGHSVVIEIDPYDEDILKEILREWKRK